MAEVEAEVPNLYFWVEMSDSGGLAVWFKITGQHMQLATLNRFNDDTTIKQSLRAWIITYTRELITCIQSWMTNCSIWFRIRIWINETWRAQGEGGAGAFEFELEFKFMDHMREHEFDCEYAFRSNLGSNLNSKFVHPVSQTEFDWTCEY